MNLHPLFPTPVAFFTMPRDYTNAEINFIKNLSQRSNMGNTSSENNYVLASPELANIADFVNESVREYLAQIYAPMRDVNLRVTQSWCNYTTPGQFHHKHEHPNSFVSGVLYIQSDPKLDRIYFYRSGYQQLKLPTETFNPYNSESWWFEAVPGQLILFPSHLTHMVETTRSADTRISLSFNTFPVGQVGSNQELTELLL
jgi:uncharacterized protein (TIGR02466 family)